MAGFSTLLAILAAIAVVSAEAVTTTTTLADDAPSPAPAGPLNLTEILRKAGQHDAFIRLLEDTEVTSQVASLLDSSGRGDGVTVLAPTDAAFAALRPPGALNRMDAQAQSQLVLFHVLPRYYSLVAFETTTNPVRTQASGPSGVGTVNVTTGGQRMMQVNVSSGLVEATLGKPLYSAYPLAVYPLDTVLLPPDLFGRGGADKQDGAVAPAPAAGKPHKQTPSSSSAAPEAAADEAPATAASGADTRPAWPAFVVTLSAVALSLLNVP